MRKGLSNETEKRNFSDFISSESKGLPGRGYVPDRDSLNLKSVLTGYIFVALMMSPEVLEEGWITCEEKEDYDILNEYLVP